MIQTAGWRWSDLPNCDARQFCRPFTAKISRRATTRGYYGSTSASSNGCGGAGVVGLAKTVAEVDPDGTAGDERLVRETVYDVLGRPVGTRTGTGSAPGSWVCTSYDSRGRVTSVTYPAFGAQTGTRTVTTSRSTDGLTTTTGDGSGSLVTTVDLLGRVTSSTDAAGKTT